MKTTCKQVERKDRDGVVTARYWVVNAGSVGVKIYQGTIRGAPVFTVTYHRYGKRQRDNRATFEAARTHAETTAQEIAKGICPVIAMTAEDRALFSRALSVLDGFPLDLAAIQFADARQKLGDIPLAQAVDYYVQRHPGNSAVTRTVTQLKNEFVAAKKADGCSPVYLHDLEVRLGHFAEAFQCSIVSVTTEGIVSFLRSLKVGGRSRNNYRTALRTMFNYAAGLSMIAKDQIDWEAVALAKEKQTEIEIFTPDELKKILAAARWAVGENIKLGTRTSYKENQGLLPLVVLGAFAGLRTAEVLRQRWDDINLERGFIRVTAAKGNTAQKRLVPIQPNLAKWVALCRRDRSALCCTYGRVDGAIKCLAERAGVEWKHNALRHSYISYRVAETQDVAKVSLEAGNSPAMIHRHYREVVLPEQAKEWFSIVPGSSREQLSKPSEPRAKESIEAAGATA